MKPFGPISILLFSFLTISCSQEEIKPTVSISEYSKLEIGNYWVYEWFEISPNGTEEPYGKIDSVYIAKDTLIQDHTYFIKSGTFLGNESMNILFDSANSLYDYTTKEIQFTIDPTKKSIRNFGSSDSPLAIGTYSLNIESESVDVPAGTFDCLNYEGKIESTESDYAYGTRLNSNLYSSSVGLVKITTNYYSSPNNLEMRLVRYGKN